MNRRSFVAATLAAPAVPSSAAPTESAPGRPALRCSPDGTFRILAISDLHYTPRIDVHGIALAERLIDTEKPNLVVVNGDCLSGKDSQSESELRTSIGHVAAAMEKKQVPWAITFGNHDQEHCPKTQIGKEAVLAIYSAYPHNLNGGYARGLHGAGNKNLVVWNAAGTKPVYSVWLLDSQDYFQDGKNRSYDWIHTDQVLWYYQTSSELEKQHGAKVPGLMFFHIPLCEFNEMVNHAKIIGTRQEHESPSPVNSGLFAALLDRGDVRGVYCGHDHVNNYVGRWRGIELGYDGSLGHYTYPHVQPDDPSNLHVRGGRVFEITDGAPARHRTWMRFKDGSKNWESLSDAYIHDQIKD
ncbi:metallophosphoesterase family protein [uncultured Paludibaculum sp.]|uniref:metallophosphoesterase family protein n=1 Tax=uncultured Paludibaculum sp. TaxID=1765020 RepID=UPI002AAB211F|nr:metallophosphoesterase family protein [uncultured Paludibaculum sp.]